MSRRWAWAGLSGMAVAVGIVVAADQAKPSLDQLPAPAREALLKLADGAPITEVEREKEHGVMMYEAEWGVNGRQVEAAVTADGDLVEMEEKVSLENVPEAVQATAAKEFGPGVKVSIEKVTLVVYELEGKANGKEKEILVQPTGAILKGGAEEGDDDDDDDEGDDEDDDDGEQEEAVSLEQLPEAVRATILAEANGAKVHEIERETKNGQTVYEAEWKVNGQEVEVKVAADGKLLKKEVGADDDEGEDDDDDDK